MSEYLRNTFNRIIKSIETIIAHQEAINEDQKEIIGKHVKILSLQEKISENQKKIIDNPETIK